MIDQIRQALDRPVRELPAWVLLAACAVLIGAGGLGFSLLDDPSQTAQDARPTPAEKTEEITHPPTPGGITYGPPPGEDIDLPSDEGDLDPSITREEIEAARSTARTFLEQWLPYTYGHGTVADIKNIGPDLRHWLEQSTPRVPDASATATPGS